MRVFFATDIHGSDICWRKFLNAGKFHKVDVLIMGGDMTGKAMVPIVQAPSGWDVTLQEQPIHLASEDELVAMEKRISGRGYYPVRVTRDELDTWAADSTLMEARFKAEMLASVERWMALADERMAGSGIRVIVSPANDDMFEIDPIIDRPSSSSWARRTHRARRLLARFDRLGQPHALEHVPRAARARAPRAHRRPGGPGGRPASRHLQLPRAALWLEP